LREGSKCDLLTKAAHVIYCQERRHYQEGQISYPEYIEKICEDFAARKAGFAIQSHDKVWHIPGIALESGLRVKKIKILDCDTRQGDFEINGIEMQVPFTSAEYYDADEIQIGTDEEFCVLKKMSIDKKFSELKEELGLQKLRDKMYELRTIELGSQGYVSEGYQILDYLTAIAFNSLDPEGKKRIQDLGIVDKIHQGVETLEEAREILETERSLNEDQKILSKFRIPYYCSKREHWIIPDFDNGNLVISEYGLPRLITFIFSIFTIPPHSLGMRGCIHHFVELKDPRSRLPFYFTDQNLNTLILLSTLEHFRTEAGRNQLRDMMPEKKQR
jgi:hypothetical protein